MGECQPDSSSGSRAKYQCYQPAPGWLTNRTVSVNVSVSGSSRACQSWTLTEIGMTATLTFKFTEVNYQSLGNTASLHFKFEVTLRFTGSL